MRGPGAVPGLYALESAMDELAIKLKMDPVELRLCNEPEKDESNGKPFSSRHLKECITTGAEKFGWSKRNPAVGSMRQGDLILGWGMACASWGAFRMPCEVAVALNNDGTVRVSCATQDIGTGTYTIFAQAVTAKTGIPIDKIQVVLGDSALPAGPVSGGSGVTSSVLPAITNAVNAAIQSMTTIATNVPESPFEGKKAEEIAFAAGRLYVKGESQEKGIAFEEILKRANIRSARGEGKSVSTDEDPTAQKYSQHSYGAQFVEVTWDPGIARLRVSRVVSVIDVGRIINLKPARNQVEGSVVMGVGMGIFEETHYDQKSGNPINNNLADYIVSTCADAPEIDVTFLNYPDLTLNEYGARGVGEIGLAGIAPAITAAVYHATGVRVRELPVKIENLLQA
jgi:xanthine dehydrogenase YagR molybdenum-binding subunit